MVIGQGGSHRYPARQGSGASGRGEGLDEGGGGVAWAARVPGHYKTILHDLQ